MDSHEPMNFDELGKSERTPLSVIPAKAGIQVFQGLLDSRSPPLRGQASFRGSDDLGTFHEFINFLRLTNPSPLIPTARSKMVAGSGTGVVSVTITLAPVSVTSCKEVP